MCHRHRARQGMLVTLSITTPWLGTEAAVYEPLNVPRSVWLQRSRTAAAPAGMPRALHCTEIDAVPVSLRLKSATARAFVPESVLDQTWRLVPGEATSRPWTPMGSW